MQALNRLIQAGAQEGVHDEAGPGQLVNHRIELGFLRDLHDFQTMVGQDVQVDPGVAPHLVPPAQQKDGHRFAGLGQVAGHHETIAAVIAPAGQHRDLAGEIGEFPPQDLVGAAPGVLHEHQGRNPHLIDGPAVQFPHLGGGDQFHASAQP